MQCNNDIAQKLYLLNFYLFLMQERKKEVDLNTPSNLYFDDNVSINNTIYVCYMYMLFAYLYLNFNLFIFYPRSSPARSIIY